MKRLYIKRLLSFVMAILIVFPSMVLATNNAPNEGEIKVVYFQSEDGKMVAVDYAGAIEQSLKGDIALYNAVKEYVGSAEEKGRPIYLELLSGKVLDYKLAMLDNLFKLQEIIGKEKYEVSQEIEYTHELKIVDGLPVIVERQVDSRYTIDIDGPETLELGERGNYDIKAYGDGEGNVNYRARYEYTIRGGSGKLEYLDGDTWVELPLSGYFGPSDGFNLTPDWNVITKTRFTPDKEGNYSIDLSLKDLDRDKILADVKHSLKVTKPVEEPAELVSITPVDGIFEVEVGTGEEAVKELLPKTTTIEDSKGIVHTVKLDWTIEDYNGDSEGIYTAIGRFSLPEGIKNTDGLELKVETTIKVIPPAVELEWPIEVESVFVGKSQVTENTYANIKIKAQFVSPVESVYIYGELANKMVDDPSQWRIKVEDGTEADQLKEAIDIRRIVVEKGNVHVSLFKDSVVASNGVNFEYIKDSFYIKNKTTGEEFREGTTPWNADRNYEMKEIPEGEYTIHFDAPEGMYIYKVQLGESYKETDYDAETNPLVVIDKGAKNFNYVKIQLRADLTIQEIKPLTDLKVSSDISIDDFKEALPKKATIVDSIGEEHEVDLKWDIRPFVFDGWKKPGEVRIKSDFFKLPLKVSNTIPSTRLEVYLNVIFDDSHADIEGARAMIEEANDALIGLDSIPTSTGYNRGNFSKADSDAVQDIIDNVKQYVHTFPNSKEKTDLLGQITEIQELLDDKVASRYVYYEVISEGTSMSQLALSLSAEFWTGKIMERIEGNPIINIPTNYDGNKTLKFVYNGLGNPKKGDIFAANLRFNGGVRSIDAIITNLGDGDWKIESDWLRPSSEK